MTAEGAPHDSEAVAVEATSPGDTRLDRLAEAIVDRLNPILVREVRQAVNGKGFLITATLALLATVLIGLFAAAGGSGLGRGAGVFVGAMEALTIVALFIVPLHAFFATRQEVTRGTVEHLLLSRLTPGQIVRGKLAAATVQFLMYLGIFSPLLALTFLLRGVDVPTIASALVLTLVSGLAACSLAVACGALSRWPGVLRALPMIVLFGALLMLTWGAMLFVGTFLFEFVREVLDETFWPFVVGGILPALGWTLLCALVGSAALSHPYENRSTGFRVFALALLGATFASVVFVFSPALTGYSGLRSATDVWYTSVAMAGVLAVFCLFAATEQPRLTPRVATRLPKMRLVRMLIVPFLPGAGRGLLFTLLLASAALLVPAWIEATAGYAPARGTVRGVALMAWLYVILYSGIAAFVRARMRPGVRANWVARLVPIGLLVLALLVPVVLHVFVDGYRYNRWEVYQILDPIATIDTHSGSPREPVEVMGILVVLAAIAVLANVVTILDGVTEVLSPSRWRRRRRP